MTRDQFIYALTACGCLLKDGKTWYEHNELIKCFEDLGLFEQEPQTFKWCTDCMEYDQEKHCCHRWSKVIRDTVEEMKQEQEPILDKLRAEILEEKEHAYADFERYKVEYLGQDWEDALDSLPQDDFRYGMERAIELIDKYKAESEGKE